MNFTKIITQIHKISNYENQIKDLYVFGGHLILFNKLTNNEKIETLKYWGNLMKIFIFELYK